MNTNLNEADTVTVTGSNSSIVKNIVDHPVSNNHDETTTSSSSTRTTTDAVDESMMASTKNIVTSSSIEYTLSNNNNNNTTTTSSSSPPFKSNATHSVQPPSQQHQQQQQQQYQSQQIHTNDNNKIRPIRILIISMGNIRQEIILKMFDSYIKNGSIEIQFSNGIISRELRTRSTLFYHCYNAKLISEIEYNAYIQYIQQQQEKQEKQQQEDQEAEKEEREENNNDDNIVVEEVKTKKKKKVNDDNSDDWTQCFRNIPINPNRRRNHYNNNNQSNNNDQQQQQQHDQPLSTLHYCVELWRKVKTINRGRTVFACLLAHLIALYKLVNESYDILLEDNVRCFDSSNTNNNYNLIQHIYTIIHATTTITNNNIISNNHYQPKCHMRYYGWLGSIPNLQWIYHTYIPKYINHNKNENNNMIVVVPCPKPSDVVTNDNNNDIIENDDDENDFEVVEVGEEEEDINDVTNDLQEVHVCDDNDTEDPKETSEKLPINSKKTKKKNKNDMTKPGGTNIVWGTYAYWISYDAYQIIIETLQNDIGAMVWKSKRMRYYHVKPIDKIIPRIIRNHFDTNMNINTNMNTNTNTNIDTTITAAAASNTISCTHKSLSPNEPLLSTTTTPVLSSSCIYIPICPIFFRAPMLSSNIHQQYDSQFCLSTHYQLQQLSLQQQQEALPVPILKSQSSHQEINNNNNTNDSSNSNDNIINNNANCTYHNLFLSPAEQMVVKYAQQSNYTIWKTPNEILGIIKNDNNETKNESH